MHCPCVRGETQLDMMTRRGDYNGLALLEELARDALRLSSWPGVGEIEYVHYLADYKTTASMLVDSQLQPMWTGVEHCEVRSWFAPDGTRAMLQTRDGRPGPGNGVHPPGTGPPPAVFDAASPLAVIDTESSLAILTSTATHWMSRLLPPMVISAVLAELATRPDVSVESTRDYGRQTVAITATGRRYGHPEKCTLTLDSQSLLPVSESVFEPAPGADDESEWSMVASVTWIELSHVHALPEARW